MKMGHCILEEHLIGNVFADSAISAVNNGYWSTAHQRFGYSSHYLIDPGIPFHSDGVIQQGG